MTKNEEEHKEIQRQLARIISWFKESAKTLNKPLVVYPLDTSEYRWILINPDSSNVGITGVITSNSKPTFGCLCIDSKKASYYEAEGFTVDDMLKDDVITLVPAKDVISKLF